MLLGIVTSQVAAVVKFPWLRFSVVQPVATDGDIGPVVVSQCEKVAAMDLRERRFSKTPPLSERQIRTFFNTTQHSAVKCASVHGADKLHIKTRILDRFAQGIINRQQNIPVRKIHALGATCTGVERKAGIQHFKLCPRRPTLRLLIINAVGGAAWSGVRRDVVLQIGDRMAGSQ